MKKFLLILGGSFLLLVVAMVIAAQFFLGSLVAKGVNTFAPQIAKAPITLGGASISPITGSGTLNDLLVGNPRGWSAPKAFSAARIDISISPMSLFSDRIVINHIIVEQPEFVYETRLVASNIGDLLKNIESSLGGGGSEPKATPSQGATRQIQIKKFIVRDGKVTAGIGPAAVTMPMPQIDMTDLGGNDGGQTPAQAAAAMMRGMSASVVAAVADKAVPALGSGAEAAKKAGTDAARKAGDTIKGIFGGN